MEATAKATCEILISGAEKKSRERVTVQRCDVEHVFGKDGAAKIYDELGAAVNSAKELVTLHRTKLIAALKKKLPSLQ